MIPLVFSDLKKPAGFLTLDTRFNILQGLHFLHTGMDTRVVHMDIKPDNILLHENMAQKISDFGLSRIFGKEQTRINTQNVVGAL
jgi:serine/threonine protein kinase